MGGGNPTQETAPRQQDEDPCLRKWLQPAGVTHWQEEENAMGDDPGGICVVVRLPWWLSWLRICLQCGRPGFHSWVRKICWRREGYPFQYSWASRVAQLLKNLPAMWETWVRSLGWEDPLEEEMATHSCILVWRIPWTEEPGGLQSIGPKRAGQD